MSINVIVNNKIKEASTYPCVKKSLYDHFIVFFTEPRKGVSLNSTNMHPMGKYGEYDEKFFEEFAGEIIISNETI